MPRGQTEQNPFFLHPPLSPIGTLLQGCQQPEWHRPALLLNLGPYPSILADFHQHPRACSQVALTLESQPSSSPLTPALALHTGGKSQHRYHICKATLSKNHSSQTPCLLKRRNTVTFHDPNGNLDPKKKQDDAECPSCTVILMSLHVQGATTTTTLMSKLFICHFIYLREEKGDTERERGIAHVSDRNSTT